MGPAVFNRICIIKALAKSARISWGHAVFNRVGIIKTTAKSIRSLVFLTFILLLISKTSFKLLPFHF